MLVRPTATTDLTGSRAESSLAPALGMAGATAGTVAEGGATVGAAGVVGATTDEQASPDAAMLAASEVTRSVAAADSTGLRVEVSTVEADSMAAVADFTAVAATAAVVAADTGNRT
jgi:hypothetical protein